MINLDPIHAVTQKLRSVEIAFIANGIVFLVIGISAIVFPRVIQYVFVIGFIIIGLVSLSAAVKIAHVKDTVSRFEILKKRD